MLWERYAERSRKVMLHAEDWAIRLRSPYISSEHILLGLLEEEDTLAVQILERLGVNIHQLKAELESQLRAQAPAHPPVGSPTLTSPAKQVLIRAADEARAMNDSHIDTAHLLLGLLRERQGLAAKILAKYNVHFKDARQCFLKVRETGMGRQVQPSPLSTVVEDWTQKAREGEFSPVRFWQQERTLLYLTLLRREQRNALLLGNFETTILFAQQIACDLASQSVPEPLQGRRLLQIDWGNLYLKQQRIRTVCLEVASLSPPPLIFVGTVDDLWGWSDAPLLVVQHGHIHCLTAATDEQWSVFASRYPAVAATFSAVPIFEPDESQAREWLQAHRKAYEAFHGVTIDDSAITAALHIAKEQFSNRPLLTTAKKLLDMACAYCRVQKPSLTQEITNLQCELEALREEAQQAAQAGEQQRSQELQHQAEELQKRLEALLEQLPSLPSTVTEEAVHSVAGMVKL